MVSVCRPSKRAAGKTHALLLTVRAAAQNRGAVCWTAARPSRVFCPMQRCGRGTCGCAASSTKTTGRSWTACCSARWPSRSTPPAAWIAGALPETAAAAAAAAAVSSTAQQNTNTTCVSVHVPNASTEHTSRPEPGPLCRTLGRYITKTEVEEALRTGRINARKSQPELRPCPKYAVDASVGPQKKGVQARGLRGPRGWAGKGDVPCAVVRALPRTPPTNHVCCPRPPPPPPPCACNAGRVCCVPNPDASHHCYRYGHKLGVRALLAHQPVPATSWLALWRAGGVWGTCLFHYSARLRTRCPVFAAPSFAWFAQHGCLHAWDMLPFSTVRCRLPLCSFLSRARTLYA